MTEVIFFKLLQEKKLLDKEIVIIPLGGASQISTLVSLISGLSKKYVLLLDSDNEGKKAYEKNKNIFGEYEAKNWILQKFENQEKNSLEDLYNENIRNILKEDIDYSEFNIKSIVINFYYESKNTPKRIKFLRELKKIYYEKTELYNLIKKRKILEVQIQKIMEFFETNDELTRLKLEKLLNIKESCARDLLRYLVKNDILQKIGATRNIRYIKTVGKMI